MQRALIQQIRKSRKFANWRTHRKFYYKDVAASADRALNFIIRHNMWQQFLDEDAAGKR
jgi:hypothetical protein